MGHRPRRAQRSEEHTSELQSPCNLVCRLLLEKKQTWRCGPPAPNLSRAAWPGSAWARRLATCSAQSANSSLSWFFFFNDTATTEIYTLSLHDALPIYVIKKLRGYALGNQYRNIFLMT